jgi:hypothetical protein
MLVKEGRWIIAKRFEQAIGAPFLIETGHTPVNYHYLQLIFCLVAVTCGLS